MSGADTLGRATFSNALPVMKNIALVSCAKKKLAHRARAEDLYISPLFKGLMGYAKSFTPDRIFILSAKYGLLDPSEEIGPYEMTLNKMRSADAKAWACKVVEKLQKYTDLRSDHFIFLAGAAYRMHVVQYLVSYEVPLEGKSFGNQLKFLREFSK